MSPQLYTIRLSREDTTIPWGFRLEGGVDIGHAVNILHVNPGSLADYQGLCAHDHLVRINQAETRYMRHEDAKMEIIRSGNDITLLIERGPVQLTQAHAQVTMLPAKSYVKPHNDEINRSSTVWQPKQINSTAYESKTSLEATHERFDSNIGVSHNVSPLPFGQAPPPGQSLITHASDGRVKQIKHSSYNSPMGLYNKSNTNETFERTMSSVSTQQAPRPAGDIPPKKDDSGSKFCGSCNEYIRGVFVKVQGRIPMHPECLKCCKCSVGLRNVGYFYINEKLYCERHAKQAAPPPEPGMKPVVVYK